MSVSEIEKQLKKAIDTLFTNQPNIFEFTSETLQTEWNLAHHLAIEAHILFPDLDCDLDVVKQNLGRRRPDIIFHKRGSNEFSRRRLDILCIGSAHFHPDPVDVEAVVFLPLAAVEAPPAGDKDINADTVAFDDPLNPRTHIDDFSHGLMAQDVGKGENIGIGPLNIFHIRGADAARLHVDQHLSCSNFGRLDLFEHEGFVVLTKEKYYGKTKAKRHQNTEPTQLNFCNRPVNGNGGRKNVELLSNNFLTECHQLVARHIKSFTAFDTLPYVFLYGN